MTDPITATATRQSRMQGDYGSYTMTDGTSRQFDHTSTDPRMVAAITLASRDGWAEIRPGHWAAAGAIVKALKAAGQLVDRRKPANR